MSPFYKWCNFSVIVFLDAITIASLQVTQKPETSFKRHMERVQFLIRCGLDFGAGAQKLGKGQDEKKNKKSLSGCVEVDGAVAANLFFTGDKVFQITAPSDQPLNFDILCCAVEIRVELCCLSSFTSFNSHAIGASDNYELKLHPIIIFIEFIELRCFLHSIQWIPLEVFFSNCWLCSVIVQLVFKQQWRDQLDVTKQTELR